MSAADLLELGRSGRSDALAEQAERSRAEAGWDAATALELAAAWLLAGDLRQADLAFLEADQLVPALALLPDPWGLWPAPPLVGSTADPAGEERLRALAERFRSWRQPGAQALWQQLLPQLQADWRSVLEPPLLDQLLILGRASAQPGAHPLQPPLEDAVVGLVGDAEIAAEPAASNRFWQLLASLRPHWGLARIRAADLALARGELEASGRWLADPPGEALANPWFHDVAARQAVARGAVDAALDAWAEAIRIAQAEASTASLAEIFEQRCREARRGPGVLQVRSLANRGELAAALALLEHLLADDPQWQPLRSLREQLRQPPSEPAPQAQTEPDSQPVPEVNASGFEALLARATARLQAIGGSLPTPDATQPAADLEAISGQLSALERRISDYEARFALA
jgi:tetratricopeptide (TPR) repeat protein